MTAALVIDRKLKLELFKKRIQFHQDRIGRKIRVFGTVGNVQHFMDVSTRRRSGCEVRRDLRMARHHVIRSLALLFNV